jgi:pyrroline-5-carboxylate reductase
MKIGFAGAGNMAGAMARGWAAAPSEERPESMLFCDLDAERANALAAEVGGETRPTLGDLRAGSDVLLLAVKPAALDDVAKELGGRAPAILSVMAATTLEQLGAAFPGVPAIRVMPNQPAEVRAGVLCYAVDDQMDATLAGRLVRLLGAVGETVPTSEDRIDAAMAVMSCSPAYVALFAEVLAEAGAAEGLDPDLSLELVAGTLEGTAELLRAKDPAAIRAAVAPPGGATEAGLNALDEGGFQAAIQAAVTASLERFR